MKNRNSFFTLFVAALIGMFAFASCEEDPCEDAVCAACPSSRLMIQYQDSTGACVPTFHSGAWVKGIDMTSMDTTLTYAFSDSCKASLLVRENYRYIVTSGSYMDVIDIVDFGFQDPLAVTECCLCYPADWVDIKVNGDSSRVTFPTGEYDNSPMVININ